MGIRFRENVIQIQAFYGSIHTVSIHTVIVLLTREYNRAGVETK